MTQYLGDFGVERITGTAEAVNANETSSLLRFGAVHQLVCPVKVVEGKLTPAENLTEGFGRGIAKVPAGSALFDAYVVVKGVARAGTLNVGLAQKDGTPIDADGLVVGAIATAKGISTGAGALIDTVLEEDGYVVVEASAGTPADFVDADIKIIVEYV